MIQIYNGRRCPIVHKVSGGGRDRLALTGETRYHVRAGETDYGLFRRFFLEVLVVFHRFPVASPDESAGDEKPVAEVAFRQPVGRRFGAVGVRSGGRRFHHRRFRIKTAHVRIVERIDIYCQATAMVGEFPCPRHIAEIEGRGVVGGHGGLVVGPVVVYQGHALYGITGVEKLAENIEQVAAYLFIADYFAKEYTAFGIGMEHFEIT